MKRLLFFVLVAVLLLFAWLGYLYHQALQQPLQLQQTSMVYSIKPGRTLSAVIHDLAQQNILEQPRMLLLYARLNGLSHKMQQGDYRLQAGMSAQQFLDNIFSGKVIQYSFTIIEGWTVKQLLQALRKHPQLKHTLQNVTLAGLMPALGLENIHPEGQFLPDTYHFPAQLSDREFLRRAHHAMQKELQQQWQKRAVGLIYKTPYEALIMASIVEKETGKASERQQIAGVFVRRLEKRMRLQTDPTVIYGMGDKYKGNLRKRDLLTDTPYNTYRRHGLPPTPIALPGREAIYAALHPDDSDNLYFVARGDGSHAFSATLQQHNRAVIKYQLKGRARSFSSYRHKKDKKP